MAEGLSHTPPAAATTNHTHCPCPQRARGRRGGKFNVYTAGPPTGPVVFCIHGGGYTGLTWSLVAQKLKDK